MRVTVVALPEGSVVMDSVVMVEGTAFVGWLVVLSEVVADVDELCSAVVVCGGLEATEDGALVLEMKATELPLGISTTLSFIPQQSKLRSPSQHQLPSEHSVMASLPGAVLSASH